MAPTLPPAIALLLLATLSHAKQVDRSCPPDPYADPATDNCNPLRYIPNQAVNIVAAVLYFLVALVLTWRNYRQRANWFLCLVIGAYTEGFGLVLRVIFSHNPHSTGLYIALYLFVVLSPCAFLAGNYILLGRLVAHLDGAYYLRPLQPRRVSWAFIASDITTFLIQAAGGGLSIANTIKTAEDGGHIFLAGIAAQMASFLLFSAMWAVFAYRVWHDDKTLWSVTFWHPLHYAMGFTCICFLIRSVYRTVELSQGYIGFLATHERYFLGLDTLPLLLGVSTYILFWPGAYIRPETRVVKGVVVGESEVGSDHGAEGGVVSGGPGPGAQGPMETGLEGNAMSERGLRDPGVGGEKVGV